jgi:hypothetical protein
MTTFRRNSKRAFVVLIFLGLVSCKPSSSHKNIDKDVDHFVPFVTLLANPRDYEGLWVQTEAYLCLAEEENNLYATPDDARHMLGAAVAVEWGAERVKWPIEFRIPAIIPVHVRGRFKKNVFLTDKAQMNFLVLEQAELRGILDQRDIQVTAKKLGKKQYD